MARVITFKDRKHHSNPLFLEFNLLDVFKEYIFNWNIYVYDLFNNNLPHRITDYFSFIDQETRNKEKCKQKIEAIYPDKCRKTIDIIIICRSSEME